MSYRRCRTKPGNRLRVARNDDPRQTADDVMKNLHRLIVASLDGLRRGSRQSPAPLTAKRQRPATETGSVRQRSDLRDRINTLRTHLQAAYRMSGPHTAPAAAIADAM
jgi:phage-related minor tail protein